VNTYENHDEYKIACGCYDIRGIGMPCSPLYYSNLILLGDSGTSKGCEHVHSPFSFVAKEGGKKMNSAVKVYNVKKYFKKTGKLIEALKGVSFEIKRGEIYGLLGPNGSGKSTLIRLMSTLLYPDCGRIEIFSHDVFEDENIVKRMINRVSVEASFFMKLSAIENLRYACGIYGLPFGKSKEHISNMLEQVGIPKNRFNDPLENFSRGMQQKVAISRAFLTAPVLMLLDEPTTGLDPKAKREVQSMVKDIVREHDATVLLTTHDMEEAEKLCDRISIIHHGKIVAEGTPENLKERYSAQTLEDVFLEAIGVKFEEADEDE